MRIRWTVPAVDDLQNIKDYLQRNYPHFAEPTVRAIYQRVRLLKTSPNRGRGLAVDYQDVVPIETGRTGRGT